MNVTTMIQDVITIILDNLDCRTLNLLKITCKFFNYIPYTDLDTSLADIITIPNMSHDFLLALLNHTSLHVWDQRAHLMLAAIISGKTDIVYQIIKQDVTRLIFTAEISDSLSIKDILGPCDNYYIQENIRLYRAIWFRTTLNTNQLGIIRTIYPDAPIEKSKLLCWMEDTYNFIADNDYLIKMARSGEFEMFRYLVNHNNKYHKKIFAIILLESLIACAIYGNNMKLYQYLVDLYPYSRQRIYYLNICFLQINRVDLYIQFQVGTPCHYHSLKHLFFYDHALPIETLPPISLPTFEYYVERYNLSTKLCCITRLGYPMQALSIGIYQKYLTKDVVTLAWLLAVKSSGREDLIELLKIEKYID